MNDLRLTPGTSSADVGSPPSTERLRSTQFSPGASAAGAIPNATTHEGVDHALPGEGR